MTSSSVLQTAQDRDVHAFGWDSDMTAYGPIIWYVQGVEGKVPGK